MTSPAEASDQSTSLTWPERILLIVLFLWLVGVSIVSQAFFWTVEQVLLISGLPWPVWTWLVIASILGLALLIPSALLAMFWHGRQLRRVALVWALGAVYVLLMAPMRLVQGSSVILANLLQIGLTLIGIALVVLLQRAMGHGIHKPKARSSFWLAILIALLASYPWLMWGALGSTLDTALNLTAAMLFGILAALILGWFLFDSIPENDSAPWKTILFGGLACVALLIEMSSAFGVGGLQLLLLIVVPSFGIGASAVYHFPGPGQYPGRVVAAASLIGLVSAAPAIVIDPDELALVLAVGSRDLMQWAIYAAVTTAILGWLAGLVLIGFWARVVKLDRRVILPATAAVALVFGMILYFAIGQPGTHGDQLFVILKDQVDLTSAEGIEDLDSRRAFVYHTLAEHASITQRDIKTTLDRFGINYQSYYLVNGIRIDGGPLLRFWLSSRPEVDRVLQNPVLRPLRAPAPQVQGSATLPDSVLWNLKLIGADRVWQELGVTGEGVVIGQSDTGADGQHPELSASYRGRDSGNDYNWYDPWYGASQPVDGGGHGTHTLGTVLGANTGVAPGAEWIACVNLARNLANPALYLDCLQFMLAPFPEDGDPLLDGDPTLAADVLNNSWGCPEVEGCDPETLLAAARALRQAGIFTVVSAGNEGPFCGSVRNPLAIYDEVLSVGAVDDQGILAIFSSVGPVTADGSKRTKPEVLAPGVSVLSAFPSGTYEYLDGTSMAGPHVAGVVALMWSANPALKGDIDLTEQILVQTTSDYQGPPPACGDQTQLPYNGTGYGIVDASSAVKAAIELSE